MAQYYSKIWAPLNERHSSQITQSCNRTLSLDTIRSLLAVSRAGQNSLKSTFFETQVSNTMIIFPLGLLSTSGAVLIAIFLVKTLVKGLWNPLASIPGPWYTRFSGLPALFHDFKGDYLYWYQSLHERYGPIVRVTPDEVSLTSAEAFQKIHTANSGFTKGPAFDKIKSGPVDSVFTMRDVNEHATRRKILLRAFTLTSLRRNWAHRIRIQVELAISNIKLEAENNFTDIYHWWRLMAADTMADLAFGESFGMLATGQRTEYSIALQNTSGNLMLQRALSLLSRFSWLPLSFIQTAAQATRIIYDQGNAAVERLKSRSDRQSIFSEILADAETQKNGSLSDDAIRTEVAAMQIAGSDSIAVTLTYAVWAVLKHPATQERLEAELKGLKPEFCLEDVESLPVLNSVINETLRLYSPAASTTKRLVPPTGAAFEGYYLPKGSYVVNLPWLTYRLGDIFPDPNTFDETRFGNLTQPQKETFLPSGAGPRSCIGMQLAKIVLRLSLATLFRECSGLRLDKTTTDTMIAQHVAIFITPKGDQCNVTLRSRT